MMRYIGLDIHKKMCVATEMDKDGTILRENQRIETTQEALHDYFAPIEQGKVAIESTGNWEYVYEILDDLGLDVVLVNPVKARAIAEAKIKTDTIDSRILAHLLRSNLIPAVYVGDKAMRDLKRRITERLFLTKQATQLKNRIHATLLRRGIRPAIRLFTKQGNDYLHSLGIPSIKRALTLLKAVKTEIAAIDNELKDIYQDNNDAQLLTSIFGIGRYTALSIVAVIGDINRFTSSEKLSSYFGLVPSTHQSAEKAYHGHITKRGPSTVRFLLIQCTWIHVTRSQSFLTRFYRRIAHKKGKSKAIVATARKLTRVMYWMLKEKEPFHSEGYVPRRVHAARTARI